MNNKQISKKYAEFVASKEPKTKNFPSLLNSFWVGGLICMIGQAITDLLMSFFPTMPLSDAYTWMLVILIFLGSFLTAIGWYDNIGHFAGAGSIVPITGFSNSITSPAVEFKREGIIYGMCVKMFTVAGPVIVNGIAVSTIIGLIYYFILL